MFRSFLIFKMLILSCLLVGCDKEKSGAEPKPSGDGDKEVLREKQLKENGRVFALKTVNSRGETVKYVWLYENGKPCIETSFLNKFRHGTEKGYNEDGSLKYEGEWRDDKPWNGWCYILQAGDAGSWGGLRYWRQFKDGKLVDTAVRE